MSQAEVIAVSMFSGIGGMDRGLEQAGIRVAKQCESVEYRRRVLRARFPDAEVHDDVRALGPEFLMVRDSSGKERVADLLAAGFPCQDLSVAGKRGGLKGERSALFWEIIRVLAASPVRPRTVLLENVPGLLSSCSCRGCRRCGALLRWHRRRGCERSRGGRCRPCNAAEQIRAKHAGTDLAVVLAALGNLGFRSTFRILNSRFFGVPQRRRRVFIVAERDPGADGAPEVLLEPEGGARDPLAVGEPWQGAAGQAGVGAEGGRVEGFGPGDDPDVAATLGSFGSTGGHRQDLDSAGAYVVESAVVPEVEGLTPWSEMGEAMRVYDAEGQSPRLTPQVLVIGRFASSEEAATLTRGSSSEGVSEPGRRQEDDVNLVSGRTTSLPPRFWEKVEVQPSGCWLWTGALSDGYGAFKLDGRRQQAHRLAHEDQVGPISEGMTVDHVCHTRDEGCEGGLRCVHRRCVNPDHFELVTLRENKMRSPLVARNNDDPERCPQGHPYDEENTYTYPDGRRDCRACRAERRARHRGEPEHYYVNGAPDATLRSNGGEGNRVDMQPMVVVEGQEGFKSSGPGHWAEGDEAGTLAARDWRSPTTLVGGEVEDAAGFIAGSGGEARGVGWEEEVSPTLTSEENGSTRTPAVVYAKGHSAHDAEDDPENWSEADATRTLDKTGYSPTLVVQEPPIGFNTLQDTVNAEDEVPTMGKGSSSGFGSLGVAYGEDVGDAEPLAFDWQAGDDSGATGTGRGRSWVARAGDYTGALGHSRRDAVAFREVVRRLTPTECERLQGLPDGWTLLDAKTPDGPRYAALGDAVTVPVAWWVARRIRAKLLLRAGRAD